MGRKIRVLVVDDSAFMRAMITAEISRNSDIDVVGRAADAYQAKEMIDALHPDVMTLDVHMPGLNGIEFLSQLMPERPLPVVVVSAIGTAVFDAMSAGAVDFVEKASNAQGRQCFADELIAKIKAASVAKPGKKAVPARRSAAAGKTHSGENKNKVIAIGASTGGTEAIQSVLVALGNDLPGILVVQHMPPVFTKMYADRLDTVCAMHVREACNGDEVAPGNALIAPGGLHMTMVRRGNRYIVKCLEGEKISGHCPSVDALFDSVAKVCGGRSLGILLTGMGRDGATGLLKMKRSGAATVGQDEQTSVVYGMPAVAYDIGAVEKQLPIGQIPQHIYKWHQK